MLFKLGLLDGKDHGLFLIKKQIFLLDSWMFIVASMFVLAYARQICICCGCVDDLHITCCFFFRSVIWINEAVLGSLPLVGIGKEVKTVDDVDMVMA